MAASKKHSCGSLVGSRPLHLCCFTSCFHVGRGFEFDVTSQPNSQAYLLQLSTVGDSRSVPARSLNLRVETPGHVRIPKSQCIMAATLFFGLLMSYSVHYETPDLGTEDDEEEDSLAAWEAELNNSGSSSSLSSGFSIYTSYEITGIRGDGKSLFRAIVHGDSLGRNSPMPDDRAHLYLVGELRRMAVEELGVRRRRVEKFIEGDFGEYVRGMANEYTLGGEVEILMACHVVMVPIRVFRFVRALGGLILIAEYGRMYHRKGRAIDILYKGDSRYDAFDVPGLRRRGGR